MNSGELLLRAFEGYGVQYVFGIPGGQTLPLYDAIAESSTVNHILVRDERSGPYAADAYARITGRLAVVDAVPGPGVVKLPSGLAEATTTSMPLIAIAGDLPQECLWLKDFGTAAQGLCDQVRLLEPVVKSVIRVASQQDLARGIVTAFRVATTGRPGPVVLDVPANVMHAPWIEEQVPLRVESEYGAFPAGRSRPPRDAVERARDVIAHAERPLLVVGGGGLSSGASEEVAAFATSLRMPVVTTVTGKGVIPEGHPNAAGVLGSQYGEPCANELAAKADLLVLVGFKSSQQSTDSWSLPTASQRVIHIDVDPAEIGKVFRTDVGLVGDAKLSLRDLLRVCRDTVRVTDSRLVWLQHAAHLRSQWEAEVAHQALAGEPISPAYVVKELERQLSPGDIVVSDASFSIGWVVSFFDSQAAGRRCLFPRGSATLGFGLPAAIGAALAAPSSRVVVVAGDGGIGYALGELSTCVKYGLNVTVVLLNNSCLGYSKFVERFNRRNYENTDYPPADYSMIARAFGCEGLRVEAPDEVGEALRMGLAVGGPALVDIKVDEWATPELTLLRRVAEASQSA